MLHYISRLAQNVRLNFDRAFTSPVFSPWVWNFMCLFILSIWTEYRLRHRIIRIGSKIMDLWILQFWPAHSYRFFSSSSFFSIVTDNATNFGKWSQQLPSVVGHPNLLHSFFIVFSGYFWRIFKIQPFLLPEKRIAFARFFFFLCPTQRKEVNDCNKFASS